MTGLSVLRAAAAASVLFSWGAAPAHAEGPPGPRTVKAVVAASGEALGVAALRQIHTLHFHGALQIVGIPGTGDDWEDLRTGAAAGYSDAGPLSGAQGYDGTNVWNRDAGGVVWNDGSVPARAIAIDQAYQIRMLLWLPGYGGATVTALPEQSAADHRYDVLRVTPPGGVPFELWIDAATHLPSRSVITVGTMTLTTILNSYHSVHGLMQPFAIGNVDSDGNQLDFVVTSADVDDPAAEAALRRPTMRIDDVDLPGGTTSIPFELVDNHVDLPVTINGKGPFHFLFDTGGGNLIDTEAAKALGLGAAGKGGTNGVGSSSEAIQFGTVDRLDVGGATLRKQVFVIVPVRAGFGVASGQPVDGLIGFEVLARFITTFDYANSRIVLQTRAGAAPANATTVPFTFNGQHANIACAIDGFNGRCDVDTGSRIALSVLSPFLAAHPTIVPSNATALGANGFGVGGAAMGRLGRATLTIAGFTIPDLVTDLSAQTRGAFADPFTAGNIGAGVWRRFAVTFDYAAQTMTLVPNANLAEHETYDRSGTFLIEQSGQVVVADVRPGTPAAAAGLVRGDILTTIAGKPAADYALSDVRTLFRGPAGTVLPLVLTGKDGSRRNVTLTLRDYV
jgi:hypothetical protein